MAKDSQTVNHADAIQLQAQMLCAREMFQTDVSGFIYYSGIKKRIPVNYEESYISEIVLALQEMSKIIESGITPSMPIKKNCSNCSMESVCLPKAYKAKKSVHCMILESEDIYE